MLKKTSTFGFLAAALIIAPTAAFAEQSQGGQQILNQNATVYGTNNVVSQQGSQLSNQSQNKRGNSSFCNSSNQIQANDQFLNQQAIAIGSGNVVGQNASQENIQRQFNAARNRFCR